MSLKKHTLWNLVGTGLPLIVASLVIPSLISSLGLELFGLLSIIWTLIGYFSLFDLGLGRAITHNIAAKLHTTSLPEVAESVKIGLKFTLYAGFFGLFVIVALSYPLSHTWLGVSKTFQHQAFWALFYSAIGIPFVALSSGMRGVLEGLGQFYQVNLIRMFQGVTTFAFPIFSIYLHGPNLEMIALWLVFSRVITLLMYWAFIKGFFGLHWQVNVKNHEQGLHLLQFGSWMTISNVVSPILVYLDRFIISGMYGASMIAYYTVPFEILSRMLIFPGAIGAALFPRLSREYHAKNTSANELLLRNYIYGNYYVSYLWTRRTTLRASCYLVDNKRFCKYF
jgi:O-antigen/teichoic acid export membrane protein